jgi:lipopolysaccharide transport system ATP-binding protein
MAAHAPILFVDAVWKRFCRDLRRSLRYGLQDIACELTGRRRPTAHLRPGEFWALQDVSLTVGRGQALGLVGPNGAGKTTLLRLIGGLIKPDRGSLEVLGRVTPLISFAVGFNPVLTGRENVYVQMAVFGVPKRVIDRTIDEIADFAELGDALDAPVQTYSSGMTARLGFACAVQTRPNVLLIDDLLAVGDSRFRAKCYRRLAALREAGTAFVLVSHNPLAVLSVCDRAAYLVGGRVLAQGPPGAIIARYEADLVPAGARPGGELMPEDIRADRGGSRIVALGFRDVGGVATKEPVSGEPVELWVRGRSDRPLRAVSLIVAIHEVSEGDPLVLALRSADDLPPVDLPAGEFAIRLALPYCGLRPGLFAARVRLVEGLLFHVLDQVTSAPFRVSGGPSTAQCAFYQPRSWVFAPGAGAPAADAT